MYRKIQTDTPNTNNHNIESTTHVSKLFANLVDDALRVHTTTVTNNVGCSPLNLLKVKALLAPTLSVTTPAVIPIQHVGDICKIKRRHHW